MTLTSIYDNDIVLQLTGSATTDAYATFRVDMLVRPSIINPASWITMYTGKTWIDSNGDTMLYLGDILKDFRYNTSEVYDATTRSYHPKSGATLIGVNTGRFFHTQLNIVFTNNEYYVPALDTSLFTAFRQPYPVINPVDPPTPWTGTVAYSFAGKGNGVLPQLPAISSDYCLFGGLYTSNQQISLTEGTNHYQIVNAREDTTQLVLTMADLYTQLPAISIVNDTLLKFEKTNSYTYVSDEALIEICTKPYYLQWWDCNNVFHSRGMVKAGTVGNDGSNVTTYKNINTGETVIVPQPMKTWTLNTGNIERADYYDMLTVYSAQLVYLYDARLDMRFKVLPLSKAGQWTERGRGRQHNFNITLNEAII